MVTGDHPITAKAIAKGKRRTIERSWGVIDDDLGVGIITSDTGTRTIFEKSRLKEPSCSSV